MTRVSATLERVPLLTRPAGSLVLRRRSVAQLSSRTNIGRSLIALATTPRAACAAVASAGSTCVTPSMASVTCRVRSLAASGSLSSSRFTSHDTMACIARMVAVPCVSSSSCIGRFLSVPSSRFRTRLPARGGRASSACAAYRLPSQPSVLVRTSSVDDQSTTGDCSGADNFCPETDNAERG